MNITETNKQIIELIREGKANKEIADQLKITVGAVKDRVHRLLKKYNCKNRVQLALVDSNTPRETI